jgi:alcohol dehydrogenase
MGFRVVALGRGQDIATDAIELGAHHYIDTNEEDPVQFLMRWGGAQAIVATIGHADAVSKLAAALAPQGRLLVLGAGKDPLSVSAGHLVIGERVVLGSITGTPYDSERTLDFSVLCGVRPKVEVMPLDQAQQAYFRLKSGATKFRMVLTMK